jgi:hypothetical protein
LSAPKTSELQTHRPNFSAWLRASPAFCVEQRTRYNHQTQSFQSRFA